MESASHNSQKGTKRGRKQNALWRGRVTMIGWNAGMRMKGGREVQKWKRKEKKMQNGGPFGGLRTFQDV